MARSTTRLMTTLLAIGAAGLATQVAAAQQANGAVRDRAARSVDPREQTLRLMNQRLTVSLEDARLEDVMLFLEQAGDLPLDVKWIDSRNPIGLDPEARVTLRARNTTIMSILGGALDRVGDEFNQATWQLTEDGVVEVGPKERLNSRKRLQIYDINDLIFVIPNFTDVPQLDLDAALQQSGGGGGGGGGRGVFQVTDDAEVELNSEERAQEIIAIITTTVEPEQWVLNGGTGGTVRLHNNTLIINAPDYMHRQIGGYSFNNRRRR